ncbi:hypothetical protein Fmac_009845 [Flemingia macrophylla]|uniref:DUF1771 domain-containing protein n=1 Tax=Flemingia macrophylla TaxID=520843 RepID=A0ABD1N1G0_9FABA
MEVSGQNLVKCDEEKALKCLLDAFGSVFSLEDIASAYCKASRNADLAGEILYGMQESSSSVSATLEPSNADVSAEGSSGSSNGCCSIENSSQERKSLRSKVRPVSAGSVSGLIGKGYTRPAPSANGSSGVTKPAKLDARSLPMTGIWREKGKQDVSNLKHDLLHQDMEDFLFKMLGDGFKLDRNMIRQVLDTCVYDMQKSLQKLLDRSNIASGKSTAAVGDSAGSFTDMKPKSEAPLSERKSQDLNYPRGDGNIASTKATELHQQQKEVLSSLFNYQGHSEEAPKRILKDLNRKPHYGHVVFEPPKESPEEFKIDMDLMDLSRQENIDDPEDEEDYQNVRRAVKEYRTAMNEYYKAAVDAFAKGDQSKAEKLLDQGHFFHKKAHDADEESTKMILRNRTTEEQEMELDLRDHGSKEAIRLLKCHLSSFSGIPTFEYLKVIVDPTDKDNNSKRSRRRLQVLKLLEQECITWVEGESAGTIIIHLANIDRKLLSFVKS